MGTADADNPITDSDELLLDRWRQKDGRSFERLFLRHYDTVYRVLYHLVRNSAEAEDLVQETFLILHDRPPHTATPGGVAAWLRRVALNRGYNALRGARRSRQRLERLPEPPSPADPQVEVLRAEECARVRRALLQLPERQRDLLLLRQAGLSYAEIAPVLRVAPGSIGTLLARAERAFLKRYEEADTVERREAPGLRGIL